MTLKEIIDGLKFTIDMFLFDPSTGETYAKPRNDMDKTTIDACKGAIELLERPRWIPVSERMPETTDYYLVTVGINEYGLMIPSVRTALYNAKTKDFTVHTGTNMCIVGDVIAWCDCLPEPYKSKIQTGAEGSDKE